MFFYYPYDLIKTRMQTPGGIKQDQYYNIIDAFFKILKPKLTKEEKLTSRWHFFTRVRRLYLGMPLFALQMIVFTGLEFSLYEVLLMATERWTSKEVSLIEKLSRKFELTRFTFEYVNYLVENNQI